MAATLPLWLAREQRPACGSALRSSQASLLQPAWMHWSMFSPGAGAASARPYLVDSSAFPSAGDGLLDRPDANVLMQSIVRWKRNCRIASMLLLFYR